jgi:hypothetical protein
MAFDAAYYSADAIERRLLEPLTSPNAGRIDARAPNGKAHPGPIPLAPPAAASTPYPIDALGDVLGNAARAIAVKVQCADAMAAQSVLSVASLASQALADVRLPYGQTRPLSLFCLTIAASGDRKSSADAEAMAPVRMRE